MAIGPGPATVIFSDGQFSASAKSYCTNKMKSIQFVYSASAG
jgi:hypothetical protein